MMGKLFEKLKLLTNEKCSFNVIWITKRIRSVFPLKDKVKSISNCIYEGKCTCGMNYIGETLRNVETRWKEHEDIRGSSEPAKHLYITNNHAFQWKILAKCSGSTYKRRILEAYYILLNKPSLNNQLELPTLSLFRHGVT